MNKDLKCEKDGLSLEILDKVTGGVCGDRETIAPEHFEELWNGEVNEKSLDNYLSKKEKGKLYRD